MSERKLWFLWIARCTGTPFIAEGYEVIFKCPVCGLEDAFEQSHCVRIQEENLIGKVRI
jgi:hypothetical protein